MAESTFTYEITPRDWALALRCHEYDARLIGEFEEANALRQLCDSVERTGEWPQECEYIDRGAADV